MPDVPPRPYLPSVLVPASAYTPAEVAQLGVPRGLVPFVPREPAPLPPRNVGTVAVAEKENAAVPQPPPAEPSPPVLGLGPRTRFRFRAHDAEIPTAPPSNLMRDPATARRAGAVRKLPKMSGVARWLSFLAVAVAAGAAGYLAGVPATSGFGEAEAAVVGGDRIWAPGDRMKLEAILAAESRRQPREMNDLLGRLRAVRPYLASLPLLEARADIASRALANAEMHLSRAAQSPTADKVTIAFVRAGNYGNQRHLDEMRACLNEAIALDPTRAEFHFEKAEVDRRQGRAEESLAGYDRALALARAGRVPSRETIEFRRRLLLIERGRETELDAGAYQAAFALPAPPADWLLTAAAVALQRKDSETGARWLRAARAAMPWPEYLERVDDYFFRNHADEPALKGLFPTPAERAQFHASSAPILLDP